MIMINPIRVVIADDHPITVFAVERALQNYSHLTLLPSVNSPAQLLATLQKGIADVVVTDFSMPNGLSPCEVDGLLMLESIRTAFPNLPVIVLTAVQNPALIQRILHVGVHGFVSKCDEVSHVATAIDKVMHDRDYLSPTAKALLADACERSPKGSPMVKLSDSEAQVLSRYMNGEPISAIAQALQRSTKTVSAQKSAAMRKLWVKSDADLFEYFSFERKRADTIDPC